MGNVILAGGWRLSKFANLDFVRVRTPKYSGYLYTSEFTSYLCTLRDNAVYKERYEVPVKNSDNIQWNQCSSLPNPHSPS